MSEYVFVHLLGLIAASISAVVISLKPHRVLIFIFFSTIFTPAAFFNIFFHVAATVAFGTYCPGVITALFIYTPLFFGITPLALHERLLTIRLTFVSLAIAGAIHLADVSHNVFKLWRLGCGH
jgi:hypothetical protein